MASGSAFWKGFQGAFGAGLFMTANNDRGGTAELAPQTFLLAPGGQDYVGDNSYDNDGSRISRYQRHAMSPS